MAKGTNRLLDIFVTGSDQIAQGNTINAWHVSQSVEAFTGEASYDIEISGSSNRPRSIVFTIQNLKFSYVCCWKVQVHLSTIRAIVINAIR